MVFPHKTVGFGTEPDDDISQRAVIHIHAAFPDNLPCIDLQGISLLDMVVEKRRKQVVRGCNRMEIACKMKV